TGAVTGWREPRIGPVTAPSASVIGVTIPTTGDSRPEVTGASGFVTLLSTGVSGDSTWPTRPVTGLSTWPTGSATGFSTPPTSSPTGRSTGSVTAPTTPAVCLTGLSVTAPTT